MANETRAAELQAPALGRLSTTHKAETAEHLMKQTTISIYLNTPDKSSEVLAHPNHSTSVSWFGAAQAGIRCRHLKGGNV